MIDNIQRKEEESFNLKDTLLIYVRYWPWFLLTITISLFVSYIYVRYSTYSYQSQAYILIKDEKNSSLSELAAFQDLGIGGGTLNKSSFENEIEIIKSKRIISQVVDKLDLRVRYFRSGNLKSSEVFDSKPFSLRVLPSSDLQQQQAFNVFIRTINNTTFELKETEQGNFRNYSFGKPISILNDVIITLYPNNEQIKPSDNVWLLNVISKESAVTTTKSKLQVKSVNKNSSIVQLSYISSAPDKSEKILNSLIEAFNDDAIADRNLVSRNTANFIDRRLRIITQELDSVESKNVDFKQYNRLTDIQAEGQLFLENASELQGKQLELSTKIGLVASISSYLEEDNNYELLPVDLGINQQGLSSSIQNFNLLVLERDRLLENSTDVNPVVISITDQINSVKKNILQSIKQVNSALNIEDRDLKRQQGLISSRISKIPGIAKSSRDILRQQEIKEALYLYLLQKREETAISLAVTTPKAKIVDSAYSSKKPVSPQPQIVYLSAFILGLIIPFGIIYTRNILDTKIHNRLDVEKEVPGLPILGEVPTVDSKESETITNNDRSVLAEAFRILRTNLGYFLRSTDGGLGNTIFVTSTIKGEGKTFVAYNLALSLTSTGKKVLLVGADIRNPQLHRYIDKNEWTIGLAEYLYDAEVDIPSIKNEVYNDKERFDLILSGRIPPNPAELLMNGRFDLLIDSVKDDYDYVIVDTAPTLLVTDTLLISQKADMTVYVSRAEYTDKKLLQYPKELYNDGKLKNIAFAINGIKITNFGYGSKYGYGYGYGQDKQSLMQRIKNKLGLS